jgi:hypothetical protein
LIIMALPAHKLSQSAAAARNAKAQDETEPTTPKRIKPMGGSRRAAIYKTQGGKDRSPAQEARYQGKNRSNGYIPK